MSLPTSFSRMVRRAWVFDPKLVGTTPFSNPSVRSASRSGADGIEALACPGGAAGGVAPGLVEGVGLEQIEQAGAMPRDQGASVEALHVTHRRATVEELLQPQEVG
jgi:hypothetical protein